MVKQKFDTVDVVRLEIEATPTNKNGIYNNTFELGTWGWETPTTWGTLTQTTGLLGQRVLQIQNGAASTQNVYIRSAPYPVNAGQYVNLSLSRDFATTGHGFAMRAVFLDADFAQLSISTNTYYSSTGATALNILAPANTKYVQMQVQLYKGNTSTNPDAGASVYIYNPMMGVANSTGGSASYTTTTWVDITGDNRSISVQRSELDVGTLQADIKSNSLDPAVANTVRPGKQVRLIRVSDDLPIFTGKVDEAKVTYTDLEKATPQANIVLTAIDGVSIMANTPFYNVYEATYLSVAMERSRVLLPWRINGSVNQFYLEPVTKYKNEDASILDIVGMVRDSNLDYAWVGCNGRFNYASSLSGTSLATYDETLYSAIDIDFDIARCINAVEVQVNYLDSAGEAQAHVYGPYEDAVSVAEWGKHLQRYEVAGITDSAASAKAYAASILSANGVPTRTINSVRIPLRTEALVDAHATRDLYDKVTVSNTAAGLSAGMRITSIDHAITSDSWDMTLAFSHDGSVASASIQPQFGTAAITSAWQTFTKVSPAASMVNITLEYRITDRFIEWRVSGNTAASISVSATSGDITNQNVTQDVPAELRPAASNWTFTVSMGQAVHVAITPGGVVTMYAAECTGTAYTIASGSAFAGQSPAFVLP